MVSFLKLLKKYFFLFGFVFLFVNVAFSQTVSPFETGTVLSGSQTSVGGLALYKPRSVYVLGNYAYLAAGNYLEIVDITTPSAPVHKGIIIDGAGGALLNNPTSVFVLGSYAYVASGGSSALEIVDITNPASPTHKGSITNGTNGALLNNPTSVFVLGNYAYITSSGSSSLEILNISSPASPAHVGSITSGTGGASIDLPASVFVAGNYAYIAVDGGLEIVDVTTPAAPSHKGLLTDGSGGAQLMDPLSVYVSGSHAFVASQKSNALEIVDVSNPAVPAHLSSLSNGAGGAVLNSPSSVFVLGNYAFVTSSAGNTLEIVDITSPALPTHKGSTADGVSGALLNNPQSVFVKGNYAYIASSGQNALEVVNVTTLTTPVHAGSIVGNGVPLEKPLGVYVSGSYAYVASSGSNALEILDITNPNSPKHSGALLNGQGGALLNSPQSVFVLGNYAYVVSSGSNALEIVDVTSKTSPVHKGSLTNGTGGALLDYPRSIFVVGNYAYVASYNSNSLEIIDVTTSTNPVHKGSITHGGSALLMHPRGVYVSGNYAYIASEGSNALEIIDVSNPAVPIHTGDITSPSVTPTSVFVSGNYAYGTSGNSLVIVDISNPASPALKSFGFSSGALSSFVLGNYAYVAGLFGLDVLDVSIASSPSSVGGLGTQDLSSSQSIFVSGIYSYMVGNSNAFEVIQTFASGPVATAATIVNQGSFTANWGAVAGATGYAVDVSTDNFSTFVGTYHDASASGTSLAISGLSPATSYQYRVTANLSGIITLYSNTISTLTIPATPTATAATLTGQTSLTANWNSVTGATQYYFDLATDAGFTSILSGYNNLSVGTVSIGVTGLNKGTTYYYRVRSANASGSSGSSNVISQPTIPATVTAAAATSVTNASFTANWNTVTGAQYYLVQITTDITFSTFNLSPAVVTNSWTENSLAAGTTYYYRVLSANSAGSSPVSNAISQITIPLSPSTSAATSIGQTSFVANWSASTGASGYFLDVSTSNTFGTFVTGYSNLSLGNITTYSVNTNLTAGTTYYYRVRATDAGGTSGNSTTTSVTTVPPDPVAIAASSITQTSFSANWNASTTATSYYLDVSTSNTFSSFVTGYSNLATGNVTTYAVTSGLAAGTVYYYRVRALSSSGTSNSSNTISLTTIPPNPSATAATPIAQTSFSANWSASSTATAYFIDVSTSNTFGSFVTGYNNLSIGNVVTYSVNTNITAGSTYYYRVRASNASGLSSNSNTITILTVSPNAVATAATSIAETSFAANWGTSTGATAYFLDVSTSNTFGTFVTGFNNLPVGNVITYSVNTNIAGGLTYYYRVRSSNASGTSGNSNVISLVSAPPAPVTIAPTAITQTSFSANWNSSSTATGYNLDVSKSNTFSSFVTGYSNIALGNVTTYLVNSNITAGTIYYYRVRANSASGTSNNSNSTSLTTIPPNPVTIAASGVAETSFSANWNSSSNATAYFLDVSTSNTFATFITGYNNLAVGNVTSTSVTGLTGGITYYYRVRASNGAGPSGNSNTTSQISAPPAPVATAASTLAQTFFLANWNTSSTATGYSIDVSTSNTFGSFVPGYNNFPVGNVAAYSVNTGITPGTTYYYRVRGTSASGTSNNSNTISALTLPPDPVSTAASSIAQTSFSANWNSSTSATVYYLDVSTSNTFLNFVGIYNNLSVGNVTTYSVNTGLSGGTNYYYRIRASNASGASNSSSVISVLTLPAPPVAQTATSISQVSFAASWPSVTGATAYFVDVAADNLFTIPTYTNLSVGNVTTYTILGLSAGNTYYYRVRASDATGTSANSNTITVTTSTSGTNIQSSNIVFSSVTTNSLSLSSTQGNGASRLIVASAGAQLTTGPTSGTTYTASSVYGSGSAIGTGFVVSNGTSGSASVTNLSPGLTYYFQVFEFTGVPGSEIYNLATAAGNPASQIMLSTQPTTQASALSFSAISTTSITVNFTNGNGSSHLLVAKASTTINSIPVGGVTYTANNSFGNGSQIGSGNYVVGSGAGPITVTGLSPSTLYSFQVFEFNGSGGSENYNTTTATNNPLSQTTLSPPPTTQSSAIVFSAVNSSSLTLSFTAGTGASHLIVANAGSAPVSLPTNGTSYTSNASFSTGASVGTGYVVGSGSGSSVTVSGLSPATTYYFEVFDFNGSAGSENYLTTSNATNPLSQITLSSLPTAQPTGIVFSSQTGTSVTVSYTAPPVAPSGYLVLRGSGVTPSTAPVSGITYPTGFLLGNAIVAYVGTALSFDDNILATSTTYDYAVYSFNGSGGAINYLTASPASGNVTLDVDAPQINASGNNPATINSGSEPTFTVQITDNVTVSSPQIFHRPISGSTFTADALSGPGGIGGAYTVQIKSSWLDNLGIEYYFMATDENGNATAKPATNFFSKLTSATVSLPALPSGSTTKDYRIVAFPYTLSTNNKVTTVYPNIDWSDNSKARMLWYDPLKSGGASYDEYKKNEFTTVDQGKGYWILTSTPVTPTLTNVTAPTATRNNLDSILLQPDWNEIGNPYPVAVSWDDVKALNSAAQLSALNIYSNGAYSTTDLLNAFEGGFVKNSGSAIWIKIPFTGQTAVGGKTNSSIGTDLSSPAWNVFVHVSQGDYGNNLGGFGMHPDARQGTDGFDNFNPPRFEEMPEVVFSNQDAKDVFSNDMVKTQDAYRWNFVPIGTQDAEMELVWNKNIEGHGKQLVLLDEQRLRWVDMLSTDRYSFTVGNKERFSVHYGRNVLEDIASELGVGNPYPNPLDGDLKANFNLALPNHSNSYQINFQLFNGMGVQVLTSTTTRPSGIHTVGYAMDKQLAGGVYYYRLAVGSDHSSSVYTGKIVVP